MGEARWYLRLSRYIFSGKGMVLRIACVGVMTTLVWSCGCLVVCGCTSHQSSACSSLHMLKSSHAREMERPHRPLPRLIRHPGIVKLAEVKLGGREAALTVHIVSLGFVVLRHGQQIASRIRRGQWPTFVDVAIVLDNGCRYAALFINYRKVVLAVSSLDLIAQVLVIALAVLVVVVVAELCTQAAMLVHSVCS